MQNEELEQEEQQLDSAQDEDLGSCGLSVEVRILRCLTAGARG